MTETEDARLKIIKAMLDEFPSLREKVKNYLLEIEPQQAQKKTSK